MTINRGMLVALVLSASSASAYDLSVSEISEGLLKKQRVHEALTIAAMECSRSDAENCLAVPKFSDVRAFKDTRSGVERLPGELDGELAMLIEGVRWPDDPDRTAALVGAADHVDMCRALSSAYDDFQKKTCLSHYGRLQSLHAMEPGTSKASPERVSISVLLDFFLPLALGEVPSAEPLSSSSKYASARIGAALFPMAADRGYDFDWVFGTNCRGQRLPSKCWVVWLSEKQVQLFALGAVLHMIQDSFSRAHTFRPDGRDDGSPGVSCMPIGAYFSYVEQDSKRHGGADLFPGFEANCFSASREVDDPISAGAQVLREVRSGKATVSSLKTYLMTRVFLEHSATAKEVNARRKHFMK